MVLEATFLYLKTGASRRAGYVNNTSSRISTKPPPRTLSGWTPPPLPLPEDGCIQAGRVREHNIPQLKSPLHALRLHPALVLHVDAGHPLDDGEELLTRDAALGEGGEDGGSLKEGGGEAGRSQCAR